MEKVRSKREAELRGAQFYDLEIVSKDVRTLRFRMSKIGNRLSMMSQSPATGSSDIVESIRAMAFPQPGKEFVWAYGETFSENGWQIYDPAQEYKRQGIDKSTGWQVTKFNEQYNICATYPEVVVVPNEVTREDLTEVAEFRVRGRFPVLSWISKQGATICRCSQPLIGKKMNGRSSADETMIGKISAANVGACKIVVFDARPKKNAQQARISGVGGYEDPDHYDDMEVQFLEIHNHAEMRASLIRVKDLCFPNIADTPNFFEEIERTQWLSHLSTILAGAIKMVKQIQRHTSVIIHCSDGCDRTPQLTSLAMILLDPYYRTIKGFIVLVEKEWLSFGHSFAERSGHFEDSPNSNSRSPIFLQFVDCVWQMTRQFPFSFEFNETFLITILDHMHSCLFGTFLYNCDRERLGANVKGRCQSLWSFVWQERRHFKNSSFRPNHSVRIMPIVGEKSSHYGEKGFIPLQLWKGYFLRWNSLLWQQNAQARRKNEEAQYRMGRSLMNIRDSLRKDLENKAKAGRSGGDGNEANKNDTRT